MQLPFRPSAEGFRPRDDGGSGIWRRGQDGLSPSTPAVTRGAPRPGVALHALGAAFALGLLVGAMLLLGRVLVELTDRLAELGHGGASSVADVE